MEQKYKLSDETKTLPSGVTVYRIVALCSFGDVTKRDLGGWVEGEHNLSHKGNCWVADDAVVCGSAHVKDDAYVCGDAIIRGDANVCEHSLVKDKVVVEDGACICEHAYLREHAHVGGNARVGGHAEVRGYSKVSGSAQVLNHAVVRDQAVISGCADIFGNAVVSDNAHVGDNALITGDAVIINRAIVRDNARVRGNAVVCDDANVGGKAVVRGSAKVSQNQRVMFSHTIHDLSENIKASVQSQCNLVFVGDEVICFKHVRKDLTSLYDSTFQYVVGEWAEVREEEKAARMFLSVEPCAPGLHFSHPSYWDEHDGGAVLMCRVHIDDIITVQAGKIRAKKAFVLGVCSSDVF